MGNFELAQATISRMKAPLDDESFREFPGAHVAVMKRRREWFHHVREAMTVLWWVPAGHRPTTAEAEEKIKHLRVHGRLCPA
jgi:hypothetical protein